MSSCFPAISDTWVRNWRLIPHGNHRHRRLPDHALYLCRAETSAEHKSALGLGVMLMNAVLISVANAWAMPAIPPDAPEVLRPSWIALLILIFAMIAPGNPRQMLAASLVAASFDPLAYFVVWLAGGPAPTLVRALILCWPSYACAFLVVVPG